MRKSMTIILLMGVGTTLTAQNMNPFGLNTPCMDAPTFVDIDDDEDLDAFGVTFEEPKGTLVFWENTGTTKNPEFEKGQKAPFGLSSKLNGAPHFVDIDADGDLDVFASLKEGSEADKVVFWENKGSRQNPDFGSKTKAPFGLTDRVKDAPAFVDIDNDNQKELFGVSPSGEVFYRDRKNARKPAFGNKQKHPFGLNAAMKNTPVFSDFDSDGDLDAFSADKNGQVLYWENEGSKDNPDFGDPKVSPFNLEMPSKGAPAVVDIQGSSRLEILGVKVNGKEGTIFQYTPAQRSKK